MIRTNKHGFTLVEILIVVVILGILAAIVIPQFSNASQEASVNRVRADLQTMRSQIELYKIQHLGNRPTVANFAAVMTGQTDINGNVAAGNDFGPYLQAIPTNAFTNLQTIVDSSGGAPAADSGGWGYNAATGDIRAIDSASAATVAPAITTY
jgi:general secretion pathway protein G